MESIPAEYCLITFSDSVFMEQDWTFDDQDIRVAAGAVQPGGRTRFYGALLAAFQKTQERSQHRTVIIALTDGINNEPPLQAEEVINNMPVNLNLNLIALGLGQTDAERAKVYTSSSSLPIHDTTRRTSSSCDRGISNRFPTLSTLCQSAEGVFYCYDIPKVNSYSANVELA